MTASIGCCSEWIVTVFVKIVNFVKLRRIGYLKVCTVEQDKLVRSKCYPSPDSPVPPSPIPKIFNPISPH